jgi:hypothetical protein
LPPEDSDKVRSVGKPRAEGSLGHISTRVHLFDGSVEPELHEVTVRRQTVGASEAAHELEARQVGDGGELVEVHRAGGVPVHVVPDTPSRKVGHGMGRAGEVEQGLDQPDEASDAVRQSRDHGGGPGHDGVGGRVPWWNIEGTEVQRSAGNLSGEGRVDPPHDVVRPLLSHAFVPDEGVEDHQTAPTKSSAAHAG